MDSRRRQRSISLSQPHSTTPHPSRVGVPTRLPDALGCRPSAAGEQGATLSTFPQVPLTREPTCTQAIDPGTSGSTLTPTDTSRPSRSSGLFPTSRGQAPHGWAMVHHSMATGSPIPRGCCSVFSATPPTPLRSPASSLSPVPRPVTHLCLFPAPLFFPFPWGCCVVLATGPSLCRRLLPFSRVFTPPGRLQPCGAGPLDPHPSGDRFVRLARVAPFPLPLSPAPRPFTPHSLFSAPRAFLCPRGCCAALATRPSLSRPLFPSSRVYTPPGRRQPCSAGPLNLHPSGDRFMRLAPVAFPSPFRVGGVRLS